MDSVHGSYGVVARVPVSGAHLALATAVLTPVLLASLWALSPEFDPAYRLMSEYALGRYAWVLSLTFAAWGISTLALAFALRPHIRTSAGWVGIAFLAVAGLGQVLASVFDIRHDVMHNLAGAMGIIGLPVAAMLLSRSLVRGPAWAPARRLLLALANLTWIGVLLLVVSFVLLVATFIHVNGGLPAQAPPALPAGVIGLVGWANRLLVLVDCAWVAAVAGHVIRLGSRASSIRS